MAPLPKVLYPSPVLVCCVHLDCGLTTCLEGHCPRDLWAPEGGVQSQPSLHAGPPDFVLGTESGLSEELRRE